MGKSDLETRSGREPRTTQPTTTTFYAQNGYKFHWVRVFVNLILRHLLKVKLQEAYITRLAL